MNEKQLSRKGKYMSLLLRHDPEKENLSVDPAGWVYVSDILDALDISKKDLDWIVENNNKKRFEYSDSDEYIRATQGHSFKVDLGYDVVIPPDVLFHGTTRDNFDSIMNDGLQKMKRHHVHLGNSETAEQVGMRYAKKKDKLWIISIDAKKMFNDGFTFYKTSNNVYLTDHVPSKYFIKFKFQVSIS